MAITNAQQYQQLVNKPANGKRPGYRGIGGYQSGRSGPSSRTSSRSTSTNQGPAGGASAGGNYGGNRNPSQTTNIGGGSNRTNRLAEEQRKKEAADLAAAKKRAAKKAAEAKAKAIADKKAKEKKNLSQKGIDDAEKLLGGLTAKERYAMLRATTPKNLEVTEKMLSDAEEEEKEGPLNKSSDLQTAINDLQTGRYNAELDDLLPGDEFTPGADVDLNKREQALQDFLDRRNEVNLFGLSSLVEDPLQKFSDYSASINRPFFKDVITAGKIPGLNFDMTAQQYEDAYKNYMADRLAGKTDAYGNPIGGYRRENIGGQSVLVGGNDRDDGAGQKILPIDDKKDDTEEVIDPRDYTGIAPRFMGSIFDFSGPQFAADGGIMRAGYMDGGRMRQMEMMQDEDDPEGGIMDLESGRQMYFLGKLVKKAGRAIKKVVKSPIGKAALLYFGGNALMGGGGGGLSSLFKSGKGLSLKNLIMGKPLGFKTAGDSVARSGGLLNFIKDNPYLSILGGSTALAGLSGKDEDEGTDLDEYYKAQGIDIDAIRNNPNRFLARRFVGMADGGRTGYQEGGDAEPVAKKTMPLLDMGGMEKDYRKDGGFVPIGRMERADDVPARLSKNEFVFTADAVRNAGDGDIDKGAEVMYNMMKNLESGGEVSEESQGLDGAREMFQTSQRLEEVL